jgi:DNA-directed RNA polymerase specialized sigma24 family protein
MSASTSSSLIASLIERGLSGDVQALQALCEELRDKLEGCIEKWLGQQGCKDPDQAEEIGQEIWEKVFEDPERLREVTETVNEDRLVGSLVKIADNALNCHRRAESRRQRREREVARPEGQYDTAAQEKDDLAQLLEKLTPALREYLLECLGVLPEKERSQHARRELRYRLLKMLRELGWFPNEPA